MYLRHKTKSGLKIAKLNIEEYEVKVVDENETTTLYMFINEPYNLTEQSLQMNFRKARQLKNANDIYGSAFSQNELDKYREELCIRFGENEITLLEGYQRDELWGYIMDSIENEVAILDINDWYNKNFNKEEVNDEIRKYPK